MTDYSAGTVEIGLCACLLTAEGPCVQCVLACLRSDYFVFCCYRRGLTSSSRRSLTTM